MKVRASRGCFGLFGCGMAGGYRSSRSTASFGRGSGRDSAGSSAATLTVILAALGMTRGEGQFD